MKRIDVRHLPCPGPVIEVRKLLDAGDREIEVLVADDLARSNVTRFASSRSASVEAEPLDGGGWTLRVHATEVSTMAPPEGDQGLECALPGEGEAVAQPGRPLVVQVTGDRMGLGDDDLGALLLRSFLKTQLQLEAHLRPDTIIFYNAGVRLCCEGSPLLDDLQALEESGVEIIACGTCLNFFGLAPRLAVGRGSDMLEIASRLAGAGRVVRP